MKNCLIVLCSYLILLSISYACISNMKSNNAGDYLVRVDQLPKPIGGIESIMKKIEHHSFKIEQGIEGKAYFMVFINETGIVDDVKVVKGLFEKYDKVAMTAIRETMFEPGMNGGNAVKVKMAISIEFND